MSNQKLSAEELQQIQQLQERSQAVVVELGTIQVGRINLDAREEAAERALQELKDAETTLAAELQEKYGTGTINLDTGEIEATEE
jgi:hypothetical protein